jgi:mannosyltransferase
VKRISGPVVGVVACLLLAANAFWVHYAQEARSYSLAMFLVTLGTYLLMRALEKVTTRSWVLYGCVMGAALYAHFWALFVLLAHASFVLVQRKRSGALKQPALGWGIALALGLPLLGFVVVNDNGQVDWLTQPGLVDLTTHLEEFAGDAGGLLLALYALLVGAAIFAAVRDRGAGSSASPLLLLWLLVPIAVGFLISQFKPIFHARFLIVSLPALAGVAALGIASLRIRAVQLLALGLVVALAVSALPDWYEHEKQPWREMTAYIATHAEPGDLMVMSPFARRTIEYYVEQSKLEDDFPEPVWPEGEWGAKPLVFLPFGSGLTEIERALDGADRVWFALIVPDHPVNVARQESVDPGCRRTGRWARGMFTLFECG